MTRAFTLIELLVVITIIVVLLALLTPALDKAIYQAELAQDAAQLKAIAGGAQLYAMSHNRYYPNRPLEVSEGIYGGHWLFPNQLTAGDGTSTFGADLRDQLEGYVPLASLSDPFSAELDLSREAAPPTGKVLANYSMFFGWGYFYRKLKVMKRLGDRWSYDGSSTTYGDGMVRNYSVIAAEHDRTNFYGTNAHPDKDGRLFVQTDPAIDVVDPWYLTRWINHPGAHDHDRGPVDHHYAYTDGSVRRIVDMLVNHPNDAPTLDERMARVPTNSGSLGESRYRNVPVN